MHSHHVLVPWTFRAPPRLQLAYVPVKQADIFLPQACGQELSRTILILEQPVRSAPQPIIPNWRFYVGPNSTFPFRHNASIFIHVPGKEVRLRVALKLLVCALPLVRGVLGVLGLPLSSSKKSANAVLPLVSESDLVSATATVVLLLNLNDFVEAVPFSVQKATCA